MNPVDPAQRIRRMADGSFVRRGWFQTHDPTSPAAITASLYYPPHHIIVHSHDRHDHLRRDLRLLHVHGRASRYRERSTSTSSSYTMKRFSFLCTVLLVVSSLALYAEGGPCSARTTPTIDIDGMGSLPASLSPHRSEVFTENRGQWDPEARYHMGLDGMNVWITDR